MNRLVLAGKMQAAETASFCGGMLALFSTARPDGGQNEDAAIAIELAEGRGVFGVADGAGGENAGDRAAAAAVRTLQAELAHPERAVRECILTGFEGANRAVLGLGVGALCTLAIVEIDGRSVRSYHVGDSFLFVTGQRGKRKLENIPHSPVGYAVEAGVLDEGEALLHEERHVVTNMVGATGMRIELSTTLELAERDTLVVASDGLSDNLHVDEVAAIVRSGPLVEAAAKLAAAARARMTSPTDGQPCKPDDLTFLLYRPGA